MKARSAFDFAFSAIQGLATLFFIVLFFIYAANPVDGSFLDSTNLAFHEAGHTIFRLLGEFVGILGGPFLQLAIPAFLVSYFTAKGSYYAGSIMSLWLGQSLINTSVYVKDAITMQLPLLGGESVIHDWNYILTKAGALEYTASIGNIFFWIGVLVTATASALSLYFTIYNPKTVVVHE
ncbi:MAG TPA: hypothetical protein VGE62_03555 [Candidatus Paceibacterota bacterium]